MDKRLGCQADAVKVNDYRLSSRKGWLQLLNSQTAGYVFVLSKTSSSWAYVNRGFLYFFRFSP